MNIIEAAKLSRLSLEELESLHRAADTELMMLYQYKHDIHELMEKKRPVVTPSADAHMMGARSK